MEGNSILLQMEVTIKLPVEESLECVDINFFSIPAGALKVINIPELSKQDTQDALNELTKNVESETAEEEANKDVVTLLRETLLSISKLNPATTSATTSTTTIASTRAKRDLNENRLFHFFKINLPTIRVFYQGNRPTQKVAFRTCEKKSGLTICQLGGPEEFYNHSVCIEGLIGNNRQKILHTCPAVIRSGSPCEFKKLETGVIVSAHETIQVHKLGKRRIMGTFTKPQEMKCATQSVCVIRKESDPQEVLCSNLRFVVDAQTHKQLHTEIEEVSLNVTFSDLRYQGFHNEDLHQVAKLTIPFSENIVASGHTFTNIVFLVAVGIGFITIIGLCYKCTRCVLDLVRCGNCITSFCQRCCACRQSQQDSPTNQTTTGVHQSGSPPQALPLLEYRSA